MNPAVELDGACVAFDGGRGLDGVSATLAQGRTVALIGPSGAGKSTLLRLVAGMRAPTAGTVLTLGQPLASLRGTAYRTLRDRVGMLEQGDTLTPGLSVLHNVFAGRLGRWSAARAVRNRVLPRAADTDDARETLHAVELADRMHADPETLSGGERRRVALARLAFQAPTVWLADEPTAGLDPRLRRETADLLLRLVRARDGAAIVALHDLELLSCDFDEVWGLRNGVLEFTAPAQALEQARIDALYEASP